MRVLLFLFMLIPCSSRAQEIAITFDDAPTADGPLFTGAERSEKILGHLRQYGVKQAAFFILTGNITSHNQQRLASYARAGHLLANHTHTHRRINEIGTQEYVHDIAVADSILRSHAGFVNWFRYPFLDEGRSIEVRDSIRYALQKHNLKNGYVTVDNYDWYINHLVKQARAAHKKMNEEKLRDLYVHHIYNSIVFYDDVAKKHTGRSPRHVLLLHENDLAALFLGDLLKHLKSQGWKIITAREAYADPIATQIPNVLFNGQGRVAAIAREKGIPARDLVQLSEDEEFLDALVADRKIFE
jgi:peptidoglycan/xylan/chitin deacetylase (PgdA/CDA1 family)